MSNRYVVQIFNGLDVDEFVVVGKENVNWVVKAGKKNRVRSIEVRSGGNIARFYRRDNYKRKLLTPA